MGKQNKIKNKNVYLINEWVGMFNNINPQNGKINTYLPVSGKQKCLYILYGYQKASLEQLFHLLLVGIYILNVN